MWRKSGEKDSGNQYLMTKELSLLNKQTQLFYFIDEKTQAILDWAFSFFIFAFTFILFITPEYIQDSAAVIFTVYEFD